MVPVSFIDLPLDQLREHRPTVAEPSDFDAFWRDTLAESRAVAAPPVLEPYDAGLSEFAVFDVTFSGYAGDPVKGWFIVPRSATGPLPTVVEFNGYGGGRGFAHEHLAWAAAGYAYFFMDTRGQGSAWGSGGSTPDPHGHGSAFPGSMTRGIESPHDYYYRRVYTDAVLAVDALTTLEMVDSSRIAVAGTSQGGGIAIAVAGLRDDLVAAMPDVPFLQNFERAIGFTNANPYGEVVSFLAVHRDRKEQSYRTLSYFDGVNFAKRTTAPALFSVALMDEICPPATVFASHNHWAATASIEVYEFNNHEGGLGHHWVRQAAWLKGLLA
jgi:cephalosporin-C deacetylase